MIGGSLLHKLFIPLITLGLALSPSKDTFSKSKPKLSKQVRRLLQKGDVFYKQYKNKESIPFYEKAHALSPNSFDPFFKLLVAYNDTAEDIRDYGAGTPEEKEEMRYYFKKNIKLVKLFYKKFPKRVEAHFAMAVAHGNLALSSPVKERIRLAENIEKNLNDALKIDPNYGFTYLGLGMFHLQVAGITWIERFFVKLFYGEIPKGTYHQAVEYFKKSLELKPGFIYSTFQLARTYHEWGKYKQALVHYQKVLTLKGQDHEDRFFKKTARQKIDGIHHRLKIRRRRVTSTEFKEPVE